MTLTPAKNNTGPSLEPFGVPHPAGTSFVPDNGIFTGRFFYYYYAAF